MTEETITVTMPTRLASEVRALLESLDERLIGFVPACADELDWLIRKNTPGPIVLVGEHGQPLNWDPPRVLTPEEEIELDRVTDEMNNPSPEMLALERRHARFREFRASKQEETERGLEEWFEAYAGKFQRALASFQRVRGRELVDAFDAQDEPSASGTDVANEARS